MIKLGWMARATDAEVFAGHVRYADYLQVDHKRARSLGGGDEMDNLTLLCDPCNRLKSNKLTLHELRQARAAEGRMDGEWWERERWR